MARRRPIRQDRRLAGEVPDEDGRRHRPHRRERRHRPHPRHRVPQPHRTPAGPEDLRALGGARPLQPRRTHRRHLRPRGPRHRRIRCPLRGCHPRYDDQAVLLRRDLADERGFRQHAGLSTLRRRRVVGGDDEPGRPEASFEGELQSTGPPRWGTASSTSSWKTTGASSRTATSRTCPGSTPACARPLYQGLVDDGRRCHLRVLRPGPPCGRHAPDDAACARCRRRLRHHQPNPRHQARPRR